jgi:nitrous oxidase accessory protein NosD/outer membrane lipoprotein-sorting protein
MTNKRISTLITLLLFLLLLVGCKAINQAPIITSIPITAVELGETYTYDVNATDPEGDTLTYSLITKPTGMTITSATGLIKWTSKAEGNFAVVVKVSDGVLYIIQSFTIVVSKLPDPPDPPPIVNYAPIITSIPGDTAIIGVAYLYDVNATDPEGDVLTYSLTKKPDDMTINSTTGLIIWTPASKQIGANAVIVKVSDGKKATTQSFTITVKAVEPDPEIELTGIVVDPKTMTLFVGESESIKSVTAYYEIKGFGVPIPLGYCTYDLVDETVITVSDDGVVMAVGEGTATITVSYGSKSDTVEVTVIDLVHNINQETYYHTIQVAINEANPGDNIEVVAGTYNERINIDKSLTIKSIDGAEATILNAQGLEFGVLINGTETIATFDGFTVENYLGVGVLAGALGLEDDPVKVYILNNIVKGPIGQENNNCIQVGDGTTGTIIGNEVFGASLESSGWSGSGILVVDSSNVLVSENYVHDCEGGIQIQGWQDVSAENNIIEYNLVEDNESGIVPQMNSIGTIIRYNDILNNNDEGIAVMSWISLTPSGTEIHYNNIDGNVNYGVRSGSWDDSPVEAVDAINN